MTDAVRPDLSADPAPERVVAVDEDGLLRRRAERPDPPLPRPSCLTDVLTHAVRVVGPGGTVRIGDVRSAVLLEAFHASVLLARADDDLAVPARHDRAR